MILKFFLRAACFVALFSFAQSIRSQTWQDLLAEAESLAASGNVDSGQSLCQQALLSAESHHTRSDSTVDIAFYPEGIRRPVYFRSYAEAGSTYETLLSTAEKICGTDNREVSNILLKLAEAYRVLGRYSDAEPLLTRALAIRESVFGTESAPAAEALDQLGVLKFYLGQDEEAVTFCDSSLTIREKVRGADHPEVALSCLHLIPPLVKLGNFDNAGELSERATAIVEREFGPDGLEIADCFEMTGLVHYFSGNDAASEPLYISALEIRQRLLGPDHPQTGTAMFRLANVYRYLDKPAESESLFVAAVETREKALGREHPEVAEVLHYLAMYYRNNEGDLEKSAKVYSEALRIRQATLPSNHFDISETSYRLGQVRRAQNDMEKTEQCFLRALAIRRAIDATNDRGYYDLLNAIASEYNDYGRHTEALPYAGEAKDIAIRLFGPEDPRTASVIDLIGTIYWRLGKFDRAETYFRQALDIRETIYGPDHPLVGESIHSLGIIYMDQGQAQEARRLFEQALSIYKPEADSVEPYEAGFTLINLGIVYIQSRNYLEAESHIMKALEIFNGDPIEYDYAIAAALLNLGLALEGQGRFAEADSVLRRSVELGETALGPQNPLLGHAHNNLGNLYARLGRYAEAEPAQERAVNILETALGPEHPEVAKFRRDLGRLYACSGKTNLSLGSYDKFIDFNQRYLENVFPYSSEQQKLIWINEYPLIDHTIFSVALQGADVRSRSVALEMLLKSKAMVIEAVMAEKQAAFCHYDDEILGQIDRLSEIHSQIAELSMAGGYYQDSVQYLYRVKDSLEVAISRHCSEFSDALAARRFEVPDVVSSIPDGSVLWEFVRYNPCNLDPAVIGDDKLGPPRYLAFTVDHKGKIGISDLGDAALIDSLILHARDMIYRSQPQIYSVAAVTAEQRLNDVTAQLYDLLFAPLTASVDTKDIYISPDGLLNLLPFEILPLPDGSYAIEKYRISYLSSGRDFLKHKSFVESEGDILVMADPDFNRSGSSADSTEVELSDEVYGPDMRGTTDCLDRSFNPLPYSRNEAASVVACFNDNRASNIREYYGGRAAEEALKNITLTPRVLHLATHGFFCEGSDTSTILRDNPLLRSGLVLAGANMTISGERDDSTTAEDGILTALEVSGLNLVGADLAVLSACESGVGDFVNGEGIFGLRRAFQHAGVETIVMSLWAVPDRETSQLMEGFYRRWLSGESKRDALRQSAIAVLNESRDRRGCGHPLLWGGFILTGNPN